ANEVEMGNPDLDPTRSMNWDLMFEYYFSQEGAVAAGAYYKDIEDFRYKRVFINDADEFEGYETEQPVSGDEAEVLGLEVSIQQQLSFLPGFASGFGILANYTYSWSEATLLGETEEEFRKGPLPGQSESVGNVALSYQSDGGFSARLSANYNAPFITSVRENEESDRYHDEHLQIDFSATQQISPRTGLYLELLNITNEPQRYYNGVSSRPEQQEYYSFWANAGIKIQF
ncbi:MAG: TonB-dependent receptor domain-containing protein, partial [Bacteroidota bacterium]